MRPTEQFRDGTERFFDEYDKKAHSKKIIVIPNVVPTDDLDIGGKHYPDYAKASIIEKFTDNVTRKNNTYFLDLLDGDKFGIPKIDRFMWQESVLKIASNRTELEETALDRYREIASIITNN